MLDLARAIADTDEVSRVIALPDLRSVRDLGGCPILTGGRTKAGRLFRSSAASELRTSAWPEFRRLGVRTAIDLRTPSERQARPPNLPPDVVVVDHPLTIVPPVPSEAEGGNADAGDGEPRAGSLNRSFIANRTQLRRVLQHISDESNLPVLVYCTKGQDRTGLVISTALACADVSPESIAADYALARRGVSYLGAEGGDSSPFPPELLADERTRHDQAVMRRFLSSVDATDGDGGSASGQLGLSASEIARVRLNLAVPSVGESIGDPGGDGETS